jgi:hypothetical protein
MRHEVVRKRNPVAAMKQVIFTLSSARSGTLFLRNIFRNNIRDSTCRHETFFDWGNPTLLGPAIYDAYAGRLDRLRRLLARKRDYVNRQNGRIYLESSHAFLKSAYLVALEFFPELQLIHLIRDPLKVAKSEAYREAWRRRVHAPFHYYRGDDGRRHFFWALTTNEEIFRGFEVSKLNLFQLYLIQWIEIENRALSFLKAHDPATRCITLHVPEDLNNKSSIRSMFEFFGLKTIRADVVLRGRKNKCWGNTPVVTPEDENQAAEILQQLPHRYLEIFSHAPYTNRPWSARFIRLASRKTEFAQPIAFSEPATSP